MPPKCKICGEYYWSGQPCKCKLTPDNQTKNEQPDGFSFDEWFEKNRKEHRFIAQHEITRSEYDFMRQVWAAALPAKRKSGSGCR